MLYEEKVPKRDERVTETELSGETRKDRERRRQTDRLRENLKYYRQIKRGTKTDLTHTHTHKHLHTHGHTHIHIHAHMLTHTYTLFLKRTCIVINIYNCIQHLNFILKSYHFNLGELVNVVGELVIVAENWSMSATNGSSSGELV